MSKAPLADLLRPHTLSEVAGQSHLIGPGKPLVLPTEIAALKDCEAYVKLPSDLPVTKIQMTYKNDP